MRQSEIKEKVELLLPEGATITRVDQLQKLWKGYGFISRIHLDTSKCKQGKPQDTYIVKVVRTSKDKDGKYDEDHARKVLSYQVEANFYHKFRFQNVQDGCEMSDYVAVDVTTVGDSIQVLLVLEDLAVSYPVMTEKRGILNNTQLNKSLEWLANFHATTWGIDSDVDSDQHCPTPREAVDTKWKGKGVWKQGGYHYLETRMKELKRIDPKTDRWGKLGLHADSELPFAIDWLLNNPSDRSRLSLIHGDVKAANMAFSEDASRMAMYDFQYVGVGLGVQDLAKFLTTSIPESYLETSEAERELLKSYHSFLLGKEGQSHAKIKYDFDDLMKDWEFALVNWVRFLAGWSGGFWGNVDWLQDRVEALLKDQNWVTDVLERYKKDTETRKRHKVAA